MDNLTAVVDQVSMNYVRNVILYRGKQFGHIRVIFSESIKLNVIRAKFKFLLKNLEELEVLKCNYY